MAEEKAFKGKGWIGRPSKQIGTPEWEPEALAKAEAIAKKHGMQLAELLAILDHESAGTFAPDVVNKDTGATGLIQFLPSTAADMLLKQRRAAAVAQAETPEARKQAEKDNKWFWQLSPADKKKEAMLAQKVVAQMPVDQQLDLVDSYIGNATKGKKGLDNAYRAIFSGNTNPAPMKRGTKEYKYNSGLDKNNDGTITPEEMVVDVNAKAKQFAAQHPIAVKELKPVIPEDLIYEEGRSISTDPKGRGKAVLKAEARRKKAMLEAKRLRAEKAETEDKVQFKDKADRLLDLAFPTKREEVRKAKEGKYHLLKGGSKDAEAFGNKHPTWLGMHGTNEGTGEQFRIIRREFGGNELPFGFLTGVGAHEGGHDFFRKHDDVLGEDGQRALMHSASSMPEEGEDGFETALRQALESGGRALDEEHLTNNPPSAFSSALKHLGVPDPRDSRPSKAADLDAMLKANPPANRYEFKSPAWEDDK